MDLDEVALNALLSEGIDVPTAVAGSIGNGEPEPHTKVSNVAHALGLVAALIASLLVIYVLS